MHLELRIPPKRFDLLVDWPPALLRWCRSLQGSEGRSIMSPTAMTDTGPYGRRRPGERREFACGSDRAAARAATEKELIHDAS